MVKDAGYDFLEISIDESDMRLSRLDWVHNQRNELRNAISKTKIPIFSMCLSGNRKYPIGSEDDEIRRRGKALIKKAVDFSLDIGIRVIQLAGYDEYYREGNDRTKYNFIQSLKECVRYAGRSGVTLAIETMDSEFINTIEKAMAYVDEISSPWLQVYPDIGNLSAWHVDIESDIEIGKDHIVAFHLKDTMEGVYRRVPFGEGVVDFERFSELLRRWIMGHHL